MGKTGFRHTEATKRKLSDMRRGERNPFYGRKHTEAFKAALSARTIISNKTRQYQITPRKLPDLTAIQLAYIAGLVDGEGSIGYRKGRPYVGIYNTSVALMDWLRVLTDIGFTKQGARVGTTGFPAAREQCWQWNLSAARDLFYFLNAVRPYLIIKRDRCDDVLQHLSSKYGSRLDG